MKKRLLFLIMMLSLCCMMAACSEQESKTAIIKDTTGRYDLSKNGEAIINDVSGTQYEKDMSDNSRVFYEIFVGSFSDSNGDGIGDLRGVINRFDYLNDGDPDSGESLGVEGIWLSPIFRSPSYHKYDVADYYTIDESFGTMDDLKELVALCHERNVKIILDLVINHTSSQNKWFTDFCSARRHADTENVFYDYYTVNDSIKKGSRVFYRIPSGEEFYEGNFSSDMPELNMDNEEVRQKVLDIAEYYLTDIGVDGFRFDAAKYIYFGEEKRNVEFWKWFMGELKAIKPDIYTVGEVWDSDSATREYASALNCFNFTMAQVGGMIAQTASKGDVNTYTNYIGSYLNMIRKENPDAMMIPFIANHDMDRAAGYMNVLTNYAFVAANLYILSPGSPFIYYGEEIGLKGSRGAATTDANRRLAMLWGDGDTVQNPIGSTFDSKKQVNGTVADQLGDGSSIYNYYKRLIMIRKANPEIAKGEYQAINLTGSTMGGFMCTLDGSTVGVFHNTSTSEKSYDLSTAVGHTFSAITDIIGIGGATLEGSVLTLEGQTSVILR